MQMSDFVLSLISPLERVHSKMFCFLHQNVYHHQKVKVYIKATVPGREKESDDTDYTSREKIPGIAAILR